MQAAARPGRAVVLVLLIVGAVALASPSSTGASAAQRQVSVTLATELLVAPSGKVRVLHRVWDEAAGRFVPLEDTALAGARIDVRDGKAKKLKLQKLGVLISRRWENDAQLRQLRGTVTYRGAADLTNGERNFSRDVINDFINPNLGHAETPSMGVTTQGGNVGFVPALGEEQYSRDDINELGRDDGTVLFTTFISTPHDPINDAIIRSIRFANGFCSMVAGRWFCPLFLDEADIFFRSPQTRNTAFGQENILGFFELDENDQKVLLASMYKFDHGHNSDAWMHSLQSADQRTPGIGALNNPLDNTWVEARDSDEGLYGEDDPEERQGARVAKGAPFLKPLRDSVVSVNDLEPPALDQTASERANLFNFNQFAQTNLRGYDKKQKLIVDFFEGDSMAKADRIVRINGFAVDRMTTVTFSDGTTADGERAYRLSHLYIGRAAHWKKIKDRVVKNGDKDVELDGVDWDRALIVTVCVTGRQQEGGPKRTVCERYQYAFDV